MISKRQHSYFIYRLLPFRLASAVMLRMWLDCNLFYTHLNTSRYANKKHMGQPGNMLSPETFTTPRHTLEELANVCSPDKKPRLSSMSIVKHKDHMMMSTMMAPKWMREWGQRRSSTATSRMVRQPAANCPKDCQTSAPSLQLRLQPSVWHRIITNTWAQSITM